VSSRTRAFAVPVFTSIDRAWRGDAVKIQESYSLLEASERILEYPRVRDQSRSVSAFPSKYISFSPFISIAREERKTKRKKEKNGNREAGAFSSGLADPRRGLRRFFIIKYRNQRRDGRRDSSRRAEIRVYASAARE